MRILVAILALATSVATGTAIHLYLSRPMVAPVAKSSAAVQQPSAATPVPVASASEVPAVAEKPELIGRLAAASDHEVLATSEGYVLHVRVDTGDFVERGQTVVEIENPALAETVRRAETALELAKSDLEAQQQRRAGVERRRGLGSARLAFAGAGDSGGELRAARSDENQARFRVVQAEAAVQTARKALDNSQIVAPVSGCVFARRVSVGDRIAPGKSLMRIVDVSTLNLVVDVAAGSSVRSIPEEGRPMSVTVDALPDRQFVGHVVRALADRPTSAEGGHASGPSVTIELANPDRLLKPGMAAHARLAADSYGSSLASSRGFESSRQSIRTTTVADRNGLNDLFTSLKGLATTLSVAADAQTKDLARKREAAQISVEATNRYFASLERELADVRPDSVSHRAVNLEKTADQIDILPILHVDEELVAFGAEVAQNLRMMAERRRNLGRNQAYQDVSAQDEVQIENSAVRTQGWQRIAIGLANIRHKMTRKYNFEFVATNFRTASGQRGRSTKR
jgi:RND family efflux transporter MFP subunit